MWRQSPDSKRHDLVDAALRDDSKPQQGQYLAFIHAYTLVPGRPPAEVDDPAPARHRAQRTIADRSRHTAAVTPQPTSISQTAVHGVLVCIAWAAARAICG